MTIIPDQNHGSGCQCFDCQVKHWTILEQSVGAKPVPYRAALPTVAVPVDRQSGYASESIRPAAWGQSARDAGWATQSASGAAYANDESAPPEGSELKKLHQLMRGRYLLASVLATLLATIGIFAGFKCGMLYYQSVCELRVLSQVPKVLYSVEDNASIDEIDPFVNAQMATLQSQRVLDLAMSDPQWQSLGRGTSPEARYKFAQALDVSSDKDMIVVKAIDSSPSAAMVSVNSLVNAYLKIYDEDNAQTEQWRSQALDDLQQKFSADLSATEQSIQDDAKPYGADGLAAQFESTLQAVDSLDERVQETQQDLAFQAQLAPPSAGGQSFTPEEIAEKDEYMAGLIKQRDALLHDLDLLGMKGYLRNNPQVISDNDDLTVVRRNINEEAVRYQAEMKNTGAESTLPGETGILSKELTDLQQQRDAARARLLTLSEQREKVQELQSDADETRHRLDEVSERIEELRVEENPRGRVVINSPGTLPIMPIKDTRLPFAAAGGAAGVSLGFALVLLLALTDGRLRTAEQTESQASKRPVLGLLPALPESLEECDELTLAAQGVHEIRILLQMLSRGQRQRAFTVTSPAPGAGKTSLSLALGMSFASTGQKTLLIDCDFHGRGLSRAIDRTWRPVLAKDLKEKGLASDEQIEEAIRRINGSECGLDEMLAEMGVLKGEDCKDLTLRNPFGLPDALRGRPIDQCVRPTAIDGLFALSVDRSNAIDVGALTPEMMDALVPRVKKHFDNIIIDTGPLLGSLEASIAGAAADAVIMVVSRGEQKSVVEKCVRQLDRVGASLAGVVFNRAKTQDIRLYKSSHYSQYSSGQSRPASDKVRRENDSYAFVADELGPIARAVARQSGPAGNGNQRAN